MIVKNLHPFLFFALLFAGCNIAGQGYYSLPEFAEVNNELPITIIDEDVLLPAMVYDFEVYDNYLIFLCFKDDQFIHIYDKKSGKFVASSLYRGHGPKEVIQAHEFTLDRQEGRLYVFDTNQKVMAVLQLDSIIKGEESDIVIMKDNLFGRLNGLYPLRDGYLTHNKLLPNNNTMKTRYGKIIDGELEELYTEYPIEDYKAFRVYGDMRLSISPDQTKMTVGTVPGGILECFDLSDGIRNITISYFVEPVFNNDGSLDHVESGIGFADIVMSNDYIFAAFGCEHNSSFRNIAIFDTSGHPLKKFVTEYDIVKIALDEEEGLLHCLMLKDGYFILGRILLSDIFGSSKPSDSDIWLPLQSVS